LKTLGKALRKQRDAPQAFPGEKEVNIFRYMEFINFSVVVILK